MGGARGLAGGGLLDVVEHANVSGSLCWGHDGTSRRQHCKAEEHECPDQHGSVASIARKHHDDMLTVQFILGSLEQRDERLARAFWEHAWRQGDVKSPAAKHGIPGLTARAESKPQRRRCAPGRSRGIRTTTEALHPETWNY